MKFFAWLAQLSLARFLLLGAADVAAVSLLTLWNERGLPALPERRGVPLLLYGSCRKNLEQNDLTQRGEGNNVEQDPAHAGMNLVFVPEIFFDATNLRIRGDSPFHTERLHRRLDSKRGIYGACPHPAGGAVMRAVDVPKLCVSLVRPLMREEIVFSFRSAAVMSAPMTMFGIGLLPTRFSPLLSIKKPLSPTGKRHRARLNSNTVGDQFIKSPKTKISGYYSK